jgi:hypothetical protein
MSFDLFVWKAPVPASAAEGNALLARFYEQGESELFARSEDLLQFREELLSEYPALEDLPDDRIDEPGFSPWAATPSESDQLVEIAITWQSAGDAVALRIVELAKKHRLVLFDPQGPDVHSPEGVPRETGDGTTPASGRGGCLALPGLIGLVGALAVFVSQTK